MQLYVQFVKVKVSNFNQMLIINISVLSYHAPFVRVA